MFSFNRKGKGLYNYKQSRSIIKNQSILMPLNKTNDTEIKISKPKERVKEMLWGEPTWIFLHTLAEKIKDEEFHKLRKELLDNILKICNNLPCPICSQHAIRYMNGVNFNNIQTKEQLKLFLFSFHNTVNRRKDYEQFNVADLSKYQNANTINIIRNFFYHFSKRTYNVRMAVDNLHRHKMLKELKEWLEKNAYSFYE